MTTTIELPDSGPHALHGILFVDNALVGVIAGGIFEVVNFEDFSIRVLGVVPTTRSFFC